MNAINSWKPAPSDDRASVVEDRSQRMEPAKWRKPNESIKWNGMSSSFSLFQRQLEGYLLQCGAGYLIDQDLIDKYMIYGTDYFKTNIVWDTFKINYPQIIW